ncbi:hypothetical protein SERLADRAFT_442433 [Serpula lacrymans var. lacrymans S7.9]|uniref:Uncharacterized protein n=1 Tax=Serpula lacrymans var. lacrymans (strain S7.9) TaxID=578457 RepID=F8P9G6_SERL9|nr:uncharacterized protein SERLADRAFT_442433 [Serpula lacrymans var. lacrymans S7.9]EGO20295.1 hypothetical protein SERLADRAFT_442433 [Serpula lacrymans var. lacrymans S7.9]
MSLKFRFAREHLFQSVMSKCQPSRSSRRCWSSSLELSIKFKEEIWKSSDASLRKPDLKLLSSSKSRRQRFGSHKLGGLRDSKHINHAALKKPYLKPSTDFKEILNLTTKILHNVAGSPVMRAL